MKNFNIEEFDFGDVDYNSTHCVGIQYLGEENLSVANFKVGCGCTNVSYNNKTLNVCLNMNIPVGQKVATVVCNIPNYGQEIITLKGTIKK